MLLAILFLYLFSWLKACSICKIKHFRWYFMAEAEKIQSILHGKCRMTSTFASSQLSYTSFLLLLCELFTDVTAIPTGSQPGVHMPRSVFALITREMLCLPRRIFTISLSLSFLCRCSSSLYVYKLHRATKTVVATARGQWAPPRPSLWLSTQQACRIPGTSTAPPQQLNVVLIPQTVSFPQRGKEGWWKDKPLGMPTFTQQIGCSLPGLTCTTRHVLHRTVGSEMSHFQSSNINVAWFLGQQFSSWLLGN